MDPRSTSAKSATTIQVEQVRSPLGTIVVAMRDGRVCALDFEAYRAAMLAELGRRFRGASLRAVRATPVSAKLCAYFDGELEVLDDVEVDLGGTPFQRAVWAALRRIRAGQPLSYAQLASRLDRPGAVRAVGAANSANPVALIVPCHRVIRSDGSLGGFRERCLAQTLAAEPRSEGRSPCIRIDERIIDRPLPDADHLWQSRIWFGRDVEERGT